MNMIKLTIHETAASVYIRKDQIIAFWEVATKEGFLCSIVQTRTEKVAVKETAVEIDRLIRAEKS